MINKQNLKLKTIKMKEYIIKTNWVSIPEITVKADSEYNALLQFEDFCHYMFFNLNSLSSVNTDQQTKRKLKN